MESDRGRVGCVALCVLVLVLITRCFFVFCFCFFCRQRDSTNEISVAKMEQQDALRHLTAEQKWETVISERAKAKGGRRGSTGGISEREREKRLAAVEYSLVGYFVVVLVVWRQRTYVRTKPALPVPCRAVGQKSTGVSAAFLMLRDRNLNTGCKPNRPNQTAKATPSPSH